MRKQLIKSYVVKTKSDQIKSYADRIRSNQVLCRRELTRESLTIAVFNFLSSNIGSNGSKAALSLSSSKTGSLKSNLEKSGALDECWTSARWMSASAPGPGVLDEHLKSAKNE